MITLQQLLDQLNDNQREAVSYNDGPSLVIAGAGSGKTRVLTYKIAYLLLSGYHPSSILALTFTNKAAREMKRRVADLVGTDKAKWLWMGTFHSIFSRMLRSEAGRIGFTSQFTVYDSSDSRNVLKSIIKEMQLDDKVYKPGMIQSRISFAKNNLITASAYESNGDLLKSDAGGRIPLFSTIYTTYAKQCHQANAMDFDDMLLYTNILLRDFPDVLEGYRQRFQFILVDEYQDTNLAQHIIVKRLAEIHQHIAVVGDDAQSIYSFRGANIDNILQFKSHFPDSKLFKLEQNYRSTQNIVAAANSLIKKNKGQIQKNVFSEKDKGVPIQLLTAMTDTEEGYNVAKEISDLYYQEHHPYSEFAILYRTNAQSRNFEEALRKRNIPYRIYGGLSFYQRKEIRDVLAYFRFIVNPLDGEALKRCINYPTRGIGETTISRVIECANHNQVSLWSVIGDPVFFQLPVNRPTATKLINFHAMIHALADEMTTLDAYEMAVKIVKTVGISADMTEDLSAENISRRENVQELVSGIHTFCEQKVNEGEMKISLADFLSEVSLLSDQDMDTEDADDDKLTLMTIHAAKGLEFRNVFIVGMEEELFPSGYVSSERELEEERRLFYVALTRAEERCYISYARSRFRNGQLNFTNPSRFLSDIDPSLINLPADFRQPMSASAFTPEWQKEDVVEKQSSEQPNKPMTSMQAARHAATSSWKKLSPTSAQMSNNAETSLQSGGGITVGNKVFHEKFGQGIVISLEQMDGNWKANIDFGSNGLRALLLKYAKLVILE
jgi:DNA helicase-2/ATP-dependent DNA helicase PcrA